MNSEVENKADDSNVDDKELDNFDDDDESVETAVLSEPQITDNVGDVSVEINVEELIADIENENDEDAARKKEIRRRLEDMAEEKSFEDTYAIDLGDETK
jgi:DNA-binding MltR family transcriptional regulator